MTSETTIAQKIRETYEETTELRQEIEKRRKGHILFWLGVCAFSLAVFLLPLFAIGLINEVSIFIAVTLSFFIGNCVFLVLNRDYRKKAKRDFMGGLAGQAGLTYHPVGCFPVGDVYDHRILPKYDTHEKEDGFSGKVNGVPVSFQEVRLFLEEKSEYQDVKTRLPVFQGILVRIGLRKKLDFHTIVMPCNALTTWAKTALSDYDRVKLVSQKFEKRYDVIATHQVESRYVMDPAFIERFLEAGEAMGAQTVSASFKEWEAVFAMRYDYDLFEFPHMLHPLGEYHFESVMKEIQTISSLVEILKLNPDFGL